MKAKLIVFGFMFLILCSYTLTYSTVPQMMNYQGKITTPTGALVDTVVQMTFTIYDDSTSGNVLWADTLGSVAVEKGIFSVLLGSGNPIPDSVFDGSVRYLGTKVGTDAEMTPRKAMVSVGYSYKSEYSDTAQYAHVAVSDGDWTVSGNDLYRLDGNVGIGTSNPSNPIWVNGTVLEIVEPTTNDAAAVVLRNLNSEKNNSNGGVIFGNQEEPNICRIVGAADDSLNSGKIYFGTRNAGTYSTKMMIRANGNVGIGTMSPQGALDVSSTTGAFIVPRMTTAQRDALSAVNGMIIYNTTTNQFNFYENGAWVTK